MAGVTELKKDVGLLLDVAKAVEGYASSSKNVFEALRYFYPVLGLVGSANLDLQKLKDEVLDLDSNEQADFLKFVESKGFKSEELWKNVQLGVGIASDVLVCASNIKDRVDAHNAGGI
jgi:hypothetical protein